MDEYIERKAALKAYTDLLKRPGDIFTTDISDALMSVPAADVAPVRHGRWVRKVEHDGELKRKFFVCSECGQTRMLNFHNYCPNCGAKMDLEASNEPNP